MSQPNKLPQAPASVNCNDNPAIIDPEVAPLVGHSSCQCRKFDEFLLRKCVVLIDHESAVARPTPKSRWRRVILGTNRWESWDYMTTTALEVELVDAGNVEGCGVPILQVLIVVSIMDWEAEYNRSKAARTGSVTGPSHSRRRNDDDHDDETMLNDIGEPNRNDGRHGGDIEWDNGRMQERVELLPEGEPEGTPLEQLTRHWMNERHAPDILPAQENLLAHLLDHLRRQSEAVQLLRGDPSTSEDEHIRIMLVQTEIERVKFIVRSYVRTRLYKIERYARFIATNAEIQTRLTAAERDHALRHAKLTDQHFYLTVLQGLPEKQSHLDDTPLFVPSMVTEPDKSRPVFVHALQRCPRILLPDGASLEMEKGHISLVPYLVVENLVARGEVELI